MNKYLKAMGEQKKAIDAQSMQQKADFLAQMKSAQNQAVINDPQHTHAVNMGTLGVGSLGSQSVNLGGYGIGQAWTTGIGTGQATNGQTVVIPSHSLGGPYYQQATIQPQNLSFYSYPVPTGINTTATFYDANGIAYALTIDQAYLGIMTQISQSHMAMRNYGGYIGIQSAPPKMLEGDFTMDEMDKAEQLIQELQGEQGSESQETYEAAAS